MSISDVESSADGLDDSSSVRPSKRGLWLVLGSAMVTFTVLTLYLAPFFDGRSISDIVSDMMSGVERQTVDVVGDEPPPEFNNTDNLGWELLDNGSVFHMWNSFNSYYFNRSNGIQFSNHYEEFWTTNVLMLGYYDGDDWNLLYRVDELSGFTEVLDAVTEDYINVTLWKDLSYGSYDFRLALRYHLKINDRDLTIIPYIKNLGIAIPFDIGFGWEMKDIQIADVTNDNYLWIGNNTITEKILLNQTLNKSWNDLENNTKIRFVCTNPPSPFFSRDLYLRWDKNLTYKVICKSRVNQYNAPVTLFIKVRTLAVDQERFTVINWLDADDWLGISSTNLDSSCENTPQDLQDALDGTGYWYHGVNEVHWFILDLGETHTIKKVRGRSIASGYDPTDVNIYIDDNNPPTTLCKEGITTWQDTDEWVEIVLTTEGTGRYIKVEIKDTEHASNYLSWGKGWAPLISIFDAYGDVAAPENNPPTFANEAPTNTSTEISLTPECYVVCNDADGGDTLTIDFFSNESDGSTWIWQSGNTSVTPADNISFSFTNADTYNTQYWWRVFSNDSTDNSSDTYHFTTEAEAKTWQPISYDINGSGWNVSVPVWQSIDYSVNGSGYNFTVLSPIDFSINGTGYNLTVLTEISSNINGSGYNLTSFSEISSNINGTGYNITTLTPIDYSINGSGFNLTTLTPVDFSINGTGWNVSVPVWQSIDYSINGTGYNTTILSPISWSINGTGFNLTTLKPISWSINGTGFNVTQLQPISYDINGSGWNTTVDTWTSINYTINGTGYNLTTLAPISWNINGTGFNITTLTPISWGINGTGYNLTVLKSISYDINGTGFNITTLTPISWGINGTGFNITIPVWTPISYIINGTGYNITVLTPISFDINGTGYNLTILKPISFNINGTGFNITVLQPISFNINGTGFNITGLWQPIQININGTGYNISIPALLFITSEKPTNSSSIPYIIPVLYFTINSTTGLNMNYTIYWGESQNNLTTNISYGSLVPNGTYYYAFSNASDRPETYWWSVNLTDTSNNWVNESYSFTTRNEIMFREIESKLFPAILLFALIPFVLFFIGIKKRRRRY